MSKSFFVDTTVCTACRGCQVACKQWKKLPAENTFRPGTSENPADLSFNTYKVVRMREEVIDGKLKWLFFPEQCRHCVEPPCVGMADNPAAAFRDEATGAVIYTSKTKALKAKEIIESCPYNIPRAGKDGTLAKCDMCLDRVQNGLLPACVKTCPTGAMNFGEREEMLAIANKRLGEIKKAFPNAMLLNADDVRVVYLVTYKPELYYKHAVASNAAPGITRQMAIARLLKPIRNISVGIG
jgi:formate dehydrogenase iron-sulfur subunit